MGCCASCRPAGGLPRRVMRESDPKLVFVRRRELGGWNSLRSFGLGQSAVGPVRRGAGNGEMLWGLSQDAWAVMTLRRRVTATTDLNARAHHRQVSLSVRTANVGGRYVGGRYVRGDTRSNVPLPLLLLSTSSKLQDWAFPMALWRLLAAPRRKHVLGLD